MQDIKKKLRKKQLAWIIPSVLAATLILLFLLYVAIYYHADESAKAALLSDDSVQVSQTEFGWLFDGPSQEEALIFYPGAKVEETAYAPLLHSLAAAGLDVCLVRMPLRFAFLGIDKADSIIEKYKYPHWYMGGHSLGGAMAAEYAAANNDKVEGLILLAAYARKKLDENLTEILIYGTEDRIVNRKSIDKGREFAPGQYTEYIIEGGNHAWFGNYGAQRGDGKASVSREEQQAETVSVIMRKISSSSGQPEADTADGA